MQRYSQPLPVELMVQDPSMQVQQLQMLQQRQQLANGYNILPHPGMLYRDVAYFPTQLGSEYNVYNLPNQSNASDNKRNQEALPATSIEEAAPTKAPARGRKGSDKAGSTYASRHQAAESRRRQRINDRLETLRKIVPHRERANTAAFLEEVISYVGGLRKRVAELEGQPDPDAGVDLGQGGDSPIGMPHGNPGQAQQAQHHQHHQQQQQQVMQYNQQLLTGLGDMANDDELDDIDLDGRPNSRGRSYAKKPRTSTGGGSTISDPNQVFVPVSQHLMQHDPDAGAFGLGPHGAGLHANSQAMFSLQAMDAGALLGGTAPSAQGATADSKANNTDLLTMLAGVAQGEAKKSPPKSPSSSAPRAARKRSRNSAE